jgi:hypothetical protein
MDPRHVKISSPIVTGFKMKIGYSLAGFAMNSLGFLTFMTIAVLANDDSNHKKSKKLE